MSNRLRPLPARAKGPSLSCCPHGLAYPATCVFLTECLLTQSDLLICVNFYESNFQTQCKTTALSFAPRQMIFGIRSNHQIYTVSWWVVIFLQTDLTSRNAWWPTVISESRKTNVLQMIVMDTIYPGSMLLKQWIRSGRRFHNIYERPYVLHLLNGGGFTFLLLLLSPNLVNYVFQSNISKRKSETYKKELSLLRPMGLQ